MRDQVVLPLEDPSSAEPGHAGVAVPVGDQNVAAIAELDRARRLAEVFVSFARNAALAQRRQDLAVSAQLGRRVGSRIGYPDGAVAGRRNHVGHPEHPLAAFLHDFAGVLVDAHQQGVVVRDRARVGEGAPVGAREGLRVPGAGAAAEDPGGAVPGAGHGRDLPDRGGRRRREVCARPVADPGGGFGPDRGVLLDDVAREALLLRAREPAGAVRVGGGDGAANAGVEGAELRPAHHVHVAPGVFFFFFFGAYSGGGGGSVVSAALER